jgi:hypothetical protein
VGGQGQAAPEFLFGTLYRVRRWADGTFEEVAVPRAFVDAGREADEVIDEVIGSGS